MKLKKIFLKTIANFDENIKKIFEYNENFSKKFYYFGKQLNFCGISYKFSKV